MADVVVSVPVFSTKVTDSLLSYQQNSILCDCSIICSDESVPAHQIILTIWGYQSMFQEKTEICANTYTAQDIRLFLKFLYTGKMSIPPQEVQKLSDIAKILGICLTTFETKCYMPSSINSTETLSYPVNVVSLNDFIENMDSKRDIESESPYPVLLSKVEETSINKAASTEELSDIKVEAVDIEFDKALGEKCPYEGTVLPDATTHSSEFQNTCLGRSLLNSSVLSKRKNKTNTCEGSKKKKGERALVEEPVSNSDTSEPVEEPENSDPVEEHDSVVAGEVHPTSDTAKKKDGIPFDLSAIEIVVDMKTGDRKMKCAECNFTTTSSSKLQRHMETHWKKVNQGMRGNPMGRVRRHECQLCYYTSPSLSNFKRHMKVHLPSSQPCACDFFVCEQCGSMFRSKFGLTLHTKNKHTKTYKHVCQFCGSGFNQNLQFKFHCAQHTKNQAVLETCQFCQKTFAAPGSLKRHLESCPEHTDCADSNVQYSCDVCATVFKSRRSLVSHMKGMHEPPSYSCKVCEKQFKWRSSLKAHMKASHKFSSSQ